MKNILLLYYLYHNKQLYFLFPPALFQECFLLLCRGFGGLWSLLSTGLKFPAKVGVFCFDLGKCQVPTKTVLSLPLPSWTGERKCDERLEGRDKDRERSLTNYCHGQNRLNLGRKGSLTNHQSNQSRIMKNKTRS